MSAPVTLGHFLLQGELGRGGMGVVHEAWDEKLHRRVALKVLPDEIARDELRRARFLREARAAAGLTHPSIAAVFQVEEWDGHLAIVMELAPGRSLRRHLRDGALLLDDTLRIARSIASALAAAHRAGIAHRDLKPENVMVDEETVKLLDFGIAKALGATGDADGLTQTGQVVGTAGYMAPEQATGEAVDQRADVFAFGVLLFEMLSGELPFDGPTPLARAIAVTRDAPRGLEALAPDTPAELVAIVDRCLQKSPAARFTDGAELVAALAPLLVMTSPRRVVRDPEEASTDPEAATEQAPVVARTGSSTTTSGVTSARAAPIAAALPHARPRRRWLALGGAAMAAAALAGGAWMWRTGGVGEPRVEHCADTVLTSTGPRCVAPVAADAYALREVTYRLRWGPHGVDEVVYLGAGGQPYGWDGRPHRLVVRRGDDGAVREVIAVGRGEQEQSREVWSEGGARADLVEPDGTTPRFLDGTRVTTIRREWDDRGMLRRETYLAPTGRPRARDGAWGRELEHSADGFRTRETLLAADGEPMPGPKGWATRVRRPDARGALVEERFLDVAGKDVLVDGVATFRHEVSAELANTATAYFDRQGRPAVHLEEGTHRTETVRDDGGKKLRFRYLDVDGKPRQKRGETFVATEHALDARGRMVEQVYLDAAGNPVMSAELGAAVIRYVYGDLPVPIQIHNLDTSRRPAPNMYGIAVFEHTWDEKGRHIGERSIDPDGKVTSTPNGPSEGRFKVDERGLTVEHSYFGPDGRPSPRLEGFCQIRYQHDRLRNELEASVFDGDEKPIVNNEGYHRLSQRWNEHGDRVELTIRDTEGAPTFLTGFARKRYEHDERGLVTSLAFLDTNDQPTLCEEEGWATDQRVYDRSGDLAEEHYFGTSGQPFTRKGGYAIKKNRYDTQRRRIETTLLDTDGKQVFGNDGWSVERLTYDERSLVTREAYFDDAGDPVRSKLGYSALSRAHDARGNVIEVTTLGPDGEPILGKDGYATRKSQYDERDLLIEESLFGADGAPVVGTRGWSVRKLRHDDLGNRLEESFLDDRRRPVTATDPPYARKREKYDHHRRVVETAWFDPNGAPSKGPEGAEVVRLVRSAHGLPTTTTYLDAALAPTWTKDGKQVVKSTYDAGLRLIAEAYVDAGGAPRAAKDGCATRTTRWDDHGRILELACLDEKGAPTLSSEGWATKRMIRDARGNVVDESTYGPDGKLRADTTGVARRKFTRDGLGEMQETTTLDADEKPGKPRAAPAKASSVVVPAPR